MNTPLRYFLYTLAGIAVMRLGLCPAALSASPVQNRDFAVSVRPGLTALSESGLSPMTTIEVNYFLFSDLFRMSLGTILSFPHERDLVEMATHFLGIEYAIPIGDFQLFLGVRKYKSYALRNKTTFSHEQRGDGYYMGLKGQLSPRMDWVIDAGTMSQPFQDYKTKVSSVLIAQPIYVSAGVNWGI